jgi:hypothetical protein
VLSRLHPTGLPRPAPQSPQSPHSQRLRCIVALNGHPDWLARARPRATLRGPPPPNGDAVTRPDGTTAHHTETRPVHPGNRPGNQLARKGVHQHRNAADLTRPAHYSVHVHSAHDVRLPPIKLVPQRSVTSRTSSRPYPLADGGAETPAPGPGTAGAADAGPSSTTSTRAHSVTRRTRTRNVPPSPLADQATAFVASSLTARTKSSDRGHPASALVTRRRATATDSGTPGSAAQPAAASGAVPAVTTRCIMSVSLTPLMTATLASGKRPGLSQPPGLA